MASSRPHNLYRRRCDWESSLPRAAAGGSPWSRGVGPAYPLQPRPTVSPMR